MLLEGADGLGAVATLTATLTAAATATTPIALSCSDSTSLALPLRLLFNVINVTAGKTVTNEVLGNGDATVASQSFTLQKSPLTYLKIANASFPTSTLQIQVDNVLWTEVANFNGQPPDAKVFVTQEEQEPEHDGYIRRRGEWGAAHHRHRQCHRHVPIWQRARRSQPWRSAADDTGDRPDAGSRPRVRPQFRGDDRRRRAEHTDPGAAERTQCNAHAWAGGFAERLRGHRRTGVLGHAESRSTRLGPRRRRAIVTVYVGGGPDAVAATQAALATAADPNRPVVVSPAVEVDLQMTFNVTYDPILDPAAVKSAVIPALTDPATGLFAASRSRIGDPLYDSQVYAVCLGVAGVEAVRGLKIWKSASPTAAPPVGAPPLPGIVHAPGAGGFFALAPSSINITLEAGNG